MRAATRTLALGALAATALAACGGGHHLGDYDFSSRTLAVVYFDAPAPELHTGRYAVDGENALEVVVSASGRMAREVGARRARARLDSAAVRVGLAERMAERTLERASRYLGTRPVESRSDADYLLEVDIRRLGLDARRHGTDLFVAGEAVLLDARTGREIWDADVSGQDRLTPSLFADASVIDDIMTAGALSTVSVEEFERFLAGLADYTADRIARELRGDLRDTRRR